MKKGGIGLPFLRAYMPPPVVIKTYAKINLTLRIFPPRADGYHPIESTFQSISLFDTLTITRREDKGISITCTDPNIPCDDKNLIAKVYNRFKNQLTFGIDVHLEKNIPASAGLGGGSSNAAGLLIFLNKAGRLGLSTQELIEIGVTFGADIPFFIIGGLATVSGIGEIIEKLSIGNPNTYLLVNPGISISAAEAYQRFDESPPPLPLQNAFSPLNGPNDLKTPVFETFRDLRKIANKIQSATQKEVRMSGSGSTLFIASPNLQAAQNLKETIEKTYPTFFITVVSPIPAKIDTM
jgi:4-diphosphocytidyl-2-C-methyl-D-erythritol kinase